MALSGAKYEMTGLGQFGSIYTNGVGAIVPPTDFIISAIQVLESAKFAALTAENTVKGSSVFPNTDNAAHAYDSLSEGSGGIVLPDTQEFVAGTTIYGRWTGLTLASGQVIAYLAPQH